MDSQDPRQDPRLLRRLLRAKDRMDAASGEAWPVERLAEDHALARTLAERLRPIPGLDVDLRTVQTNIVRTKVSGLGVPAAKVAELLAQRNVYVLAQQADTLRWLTHRHVTKADADAAAVVMAKVAEELHG